ncbi:hypothetical protein K456DRAFT_56222 [Colletotrichum gloeosporioides 23]|nr:hypothetical protein K456DRAFT_56222 [Colletotrichum gloeosporioides 23]
MPHRKCTPPLSNLNNFTIFYSIVTKLSTKHNNYTMAHYTEDEVSQALEAIATGTSVITVHWGAWSGS